MVKNRARKNKTFWGWVWHYCCSIKVALTILILLALTSIIGTIIAQEAPEKMFQIYQPATANILIKLGMNDMYNSWWFIALLGLFILNLTCCTIDRFMPTWKLITKPKKNFSLDCIKARKNSDEIIVPSINGVAEITGIIKKFGYHVTLTDEHSLYAYKGRWARMGYIVTHISIIMVLIGAIMGKVSGYKGFMQIQEGEISPWYWSRTLNKAAKLDFMLGLEKLYMEYYPPEFYFEISDVRNGRVLGKPKVSLGEKFKVPKTGIKGQVVDYRPDYRVADPRPVAERDLTAPPEYPAVLVKYQEKGRVIGERWIFVAGRDLLRQQPLLPDVRISLYNLYAERTKDYKSTLSVYDKGERVLTKTIEVNDPLRYRGVTFYQSSFDKEKRVSGLQVAHDPGVPIVYIFCSTMILGVMMSFYISHRQLWFKVEKARQGYKINMAGMANRNPLGFKQEYDKILAVFNKRKSSG